MSISVVALVITSAINLSLGTIIFTRNRRLPASRAFLLVCLTVTIWTISNILTNQTFSTVQPNDLFNRLAFVSGYVVVLFGLIFTYYFPIRRRVGRPETLIVAVVSALTILLSATELVAGKVTHNGSGLHFSVGPLIPLYVVSFATCILLIGRNLTRLRGASPLSRLQARFVLFGFVVSASLGLVINLIIPIFASNWQSTKYGPLTAVILVVTIGYAMVRHGLFDIRLVVARSIAYIASLGVLASVFGFMVFGTLQLLFGLHVPILAQVFISASTAVAGLAFARLKKFFDKVTNSLFYADAYDAQTLFDSLNATLVAAIDLHALLLRSTKLLASEMRTEYCIVSLDGTEGHEARIVGTEKRNIDSVDVATLRKLVAAYHHNVVVADHLDQEGQYTRLKNLMRERHISVVISLTPDGTRSTEAIGYLMLGAKKSGNPYSGQDLRVLETVANELIIAIQNALHFEEIQYFNKTLQGRVNQATKELRRTNEKLKLLDETKDEFITMASHQLRTPLTSVKGYLSMVLEGDAGKISANQRKLLEQSYASSQRMVYLISDLLNLSRLNTGKFVIEPSPVDLSEVVQAEVDQLAETAKSRELELVYNRPTTFPQLLLDETKIHQVVMNLIDNAIYYTPAGGTVTVELRETPTAVEYMVHDTGIGVPKAVQHKLFTKFYRAQNAQQARPDGTGLGLFMAKKVVVAQSGSIIFDSEQGKGSTFGFRFSKAGHKVPTIPLPAVQPAEHQPVHT